MKSLFTAISLLTISLAFTYGQPVRLQPLGEEGRATMDTVLQNTSSPVEARGKAMEIIYKNPMEVVVYLKEAVRIFADKGTDYQNEIPRLVLEAAINFKPIISEICGGGISALPPELQETLGVSIFRTFYAGAANDHKLQQEIVSEALNACKRNTAATRTIKEIAHGQR